MFNRLLIKPASYRDEKYLAFVRQWPCLACARQDAIEAAHTGGHGLSLKAWDICTVPLCPDHHRGPKGLDTLGPARFQTQYNLDLKAECLWLLNTYLTMGNGLGAKEAG